MNHLDRASVILRGAREVGAPKATKMMKDKYRADITLALERTERWGLRSVGSLMMEQFLNTAGDALSVPSAEWVRAWSQSLPFDADYRITRCAPKASPRRPGGQGGKTEEDR